MSARVRWADGSVVQYNGARRVACHDGGQTELLDDDGGVVATIQPGARAIVEWVRPCYTTQGGRPTDHAEAMLANIEAVNWQVLANLKRRLRDFDARTGSWG